MYLIPGSQNNEGAQARGVDPAAAGGAVRGVLAALQHHAATARYKPQLHEAFEHFPAVRFVFR